MDPLTDYLETKRLAAPDVHETLLLDAARRNSSLNKIVSKAVKRRKRLPKVATAGWESGVPKSEGLSEFWNRISGEQGFSNQGPSNALAGSTTAQQIGSAVKAPGRFLAGVGGLAYGAGHYGSGVGAGLWSKATGNTAGQTAASTVRSGGLDMMGRGLHQAIFPGKSRAFHTGLEQAAPAMRAQGMPSLAKLHGRTSALTEGGANLLSAVQMGRWLPGLKGPTGPAVAPTNLMAQLSGAGSSLGRGAAGLAAVTSAGMGGPAVGGTGEVAALSHMLPALLDAPPETQPPATPARQPAAAPPAATAAGQPVAGEANPTGMPAPPGQAAAGPAGVSPNYGGQKWQATKQQFGLPGAPPAGPAAPEQSPLAGAEGFQGPASELAAHGQPALDEQLRGMSSQQQVQYIQSLPQEQQPQEIERVAKMAIQDGISSKFGNLTPEQQTAKLGEVMAKVQQGGFTVEDLQQTVPQLLQELDPSGQMQQQPGFLDQLMSSVSKMGGWQIGALMLGIPLGIMGLMSTFGGGDMLSGVVMALLGFGGAAWGSGMFDNQLQSLGMPTLQGLRGGGAPAAGPDAAAGYPAPTAGQPAGPGPVPGADNQFGGAAELTPYESQDRLQQVTQQNPWLSAFGSSGTDPNAFDLGADGSGGDAADVMKAWADGQLQDQQIQQLITSLDPQSKQQIQAAIGGMNPMQRWYMREKLPLLQGWP